MIIVAGAIQVDPAARAAYLAGCVAVVEQARAAPGCLDFAISADVVEPGRINVYERWDSDAAVEAFRGAGPDTGQREAILDADVMRYRIAATEPA
ncbi:MAG TPA: antibiotic biosynthesis monooxygenase family protein [Pilimelia sp.]|nr:antibiotic biosynthesis monooxygenase family protein [Pilimelia sp.]